MCVYTCVYIIHIYIHIYVKVFLECHRIYKVFLPLFPLRIFSKVYFSNYIKKQALIIRIRDYALYNTKIKTMLYNNIVYYMENLVCEKLTNAKPSGTHL